MQKGKLYLIPNSLGSDDLGLTIPPVVFELINKIDHYIAENTGSAAKFLKLVGIKKNLRDLTFYPLNINTKAGDITGYLDESEKGNDIGLISEAGLPCIADPGAVIVTMAHEKNIEVVPLTGPSSILMSLQASGLNGQNFAFNGYLPIDQGKRKQKLKELERKALRDDQTQIFIEAPHRNDKLLEEIIKSCGDDLRLSLSTGLTTSGEKIMTKSIAKWKKTDIIIGKIPAIFLLGK
jgi:16S rRNA (cytidine1402-2'-O)-methyltransferase